MYVCMYVGRGCSSKEASKYRLQGQVFSSLSDAVERVDKSEWRKCQADLQERGAAASHRVFQVKSLTLPNPFLLYIYCMYVCSE